MKLYVAISLNKDDVEEVSVSLHSNEAAAFQALLKAVIPLWSEGEVPTNLDELNEAVDGTSTRLQIHVCEMTP